MPELWVPPTVRWNKPCAKSCPTTARPITISLAAGLLLAFAAYAPATNAATGSGTNGKNETGYIAESAAAVRILNRLTAETAELRLEVGVPTQYAELEITAVACRRSPPALPTQTATRLRVKNMPSGEVIYDGWLFSAKPGGFAHRLYSLRLLGCDSE